MPGQKVREAFAAFAIEAVETSYMVGTVHGTGGKRAGEVLISSSQD